MSKKHYIICFFSIGDESKYDFSIIPNGVNFQNPIIYNQYKHSEYQIITFEYNSTSDYKIIIKDTNNLDSQKLYSTNEINKTPSEFEFQLNPEFNNFDKKKEITKFEILFLVYNYINDELNKSLDEQSIKECKEKFILNQLSKINELKEDIELLYFIKILILLYEQYEGTNETYVSFLFKNFDKINFIIKKNLIENEKKKLIIFLMI